MVPPVSTGRKAGFVRKIENDSGWRERGGRIEKSTMHVAPVLK